MRRIYYSDDPARDAELTANDGERWLESRPICEMCREPVQDDHYFSDGCIGVCCPECWPKYCKENFRIEIREED